MTVKGTPVQMADGLITPPSKLWDLKAGMDRVSGDAPGFQEIDYPSVCMAPAPTKQASHGLQCVSARSPEPLKSIADVITLL